MERLLLARPRDNDVAAAASAAAAADAAPAAPVAAEPDPGGGCRGGGGSASPWGGGRTSLGRSLEAWAGASRLWADEAFGLALAVLAGARGGARGSLAPLPVPALAASMRTRGVASELLRSVELLAAGSAAGSHPAAAARFALIDATWAALDDPAGYGGLAAGGATVAAPTLPSSRRAAGWLRRRPGPAEGPSAVPGLLAPRRGSGSSGRDGHRRPGAWALVLEAAQDVHASRMRLLVAAEGVSARWPLPPPPLPSPPSFNVFLATPLFP